jgi:hypothetical protein
MNDSKRNSTINESKYPYRTWSLRIFNYSFSHETFIVPWQISENKTDHSNKSDLTIK